MSKLLLLYLTFVVGLVFLVMPDTASPKDYFPFYDIALYPKTYVYFILEKGILIGLAGIIYNEATEYRDALQVFFWLLVADLVDFFLTYNTTWFHVGEVIISMNTVKVFVFGLTILYVWIKGLLK